MQNEEEYFKVSDLSEVKSLLQSLDLEVEKISNPSTENLDDFYNSFLRPDKEGQIETDKNRIATIKLLTDLLQDNQSIEVFWDASEGKTMVQVLVNGQPFPALEEVECDEILANEMIATLKLPQEAGKGSSKGEGALTLNAFKKIRLQYKSQEEYFDENKWEQTDIWESPNPSENISKHRFVPNTLSFAARFKNVKRGFQAEIDLNESHPFIDFYFLPVLELSDAENKEFATYLSQLVNSMLEQKFDFSSNPAHNYTPLLVNGQISNQHIAILSCEITHFVSEIVEDQVILFEEYLQN